MITAPDAQVRPALPLLAAMVLVAVVASINFLRDLGEPSHPFWDESYYLTTAQRYADGRAQFASHPPLGLMLIAAGNSLSGANRSIDTESIARKKRIRGEELPAGLDLAGYRIASGSFAVIGAVLFFLLMRELSGRTVVALLLSNLYVFDNALVAHLRAAHLDAFQLTFAIAALLCFVSGARRDRDAAPWIDFALGLSCGLAMMVKLNAVLLLLLGAMLIVRRSWSSRQSESGALRLLLAGRDGLVIASGCVLAIVAVFAVHVAVSAKPPDVRGSAGQKDDAFVSATYRTWLAGEQSLSPFVVVAAARDYLRFIEQDFDNIARTGANGSTPLQWPLNRRTISYRWDSDGVRTSYVQLTANPVGWGAALIATIAAAWLLILQWWRPTPSTRPQRRGLMAMLLLLYGALMLMHAAIARHRVVYLYHYFLALLPAFCLVPLIMEEVAERWRATRKFQLPVLAGFTALLLASFVFYAPLSLHRPLTRRQCELRNVLQTVVTCQPAKVVARK